MSSDLKSNVGENTHNHKSEHSLAVRLGKTAFEARGHGIYVLLIIIVLALIYAVMLS